MFILLSLINTSSGIGEGPYMPIVCMCVYVCVCVCVCMCVCV